jgi:hypothetical protein
MTHKSFKAEWAYEMRRHQRRVRTIRIEGMEFEVFAFWTLCRDRMQLSLQVVANINPRPFRSARAYFDVCADGSILHRADCLGTLVKVAPGSDSNFTLKMMRKVRKVARTNELAVFAYRVRSFGMQKALRTFIRQNRRDLAEWCAEDQAREAGIPVRKFQALIEKLAA